MGGCFSIAGKKSMYYSFYTFVLLIKGKVKFQMKMEMKWLLSFVEYS